MPEILLGSMNALSVREAVLSIGDSTNYDSVGGWIQSMFSEDFLADAENSSNWIVSIEDALKNTIDWAESANSSLINTITGNDKQWGEVAKNKFLSTFVANFMNQAIQNARKKSYVPNYDSNDWITAATYDTILGSDFNDSMAEIASPLDIVLNDNTEENPIYDENGLRLPATYANFLVTNSQVLVPIYGQPDKDAKALKIIESVFTERKVIGIDCRPLIKQHGSLHCITMQLITGTI